MRIFLYLAIILLFSASAFAQTAGTMHYDNGDSRYEFFDGTSWYDIALGLVLGACTKEAEVDFDKILLTYKYCNGANWVPVGGSLTLSFCGKQAEVDFFNNSYHFCNGLLWIRMKGGLI